MNRLSQWFVIALLLLGAFGGYFWYGSKAGVTTNAPETTNNTLATGLVGHWTFDADDMDWASSGAEVLDRTASSNEGDLGPTYFTPVPGVLGQAIHSNGTAWEMIALNSATNLEMGTGDLTLCEWINITSGTSEVRSFHKKPAGSDSAEGYGFYYSTDLDTLVAHIGTGSTFTYYGSYGIPFALEGSGWHHIAYVIDRDAGVSFYLDGTFIGKDGSSVYNGTDITNVAEPGYIAYTDANADVVSHDDLRIYNRVLSASEVYQLYTAGTATVNAPLDDPLSQGLRGYWKMDEGTGTSTTADASGNGNTLTMTAMESGDWVTGTIGPYSLDFDGSAEYLTIASPSSVLDFPAGASFTLAGWFNRDTFSANDHTIISNVSAQGNDGYIVWIDNNNSLYFRADDNADGNYRQIQSDLAFSATGWHHFAVSWDDDLDANLYIDGALDGATKTGIFANVDDLTNANAFRIGAETGTADNFFDGKLDDIRVYGYALSAGEVSKLYQTTAPTQPVDTGLVGHWTFDGPDIQGTTAIDRSSFGNNGAITGATKTIGKLGQGLSFDGSGDYVNAGDTSSLNLTSSFSISFWVNGNSFPGGYYYQLLSKGSRGAGSYFLLVDVANYSEGDQRFRFGFTSGGSWSTVDSTTVVATGTWWHIAGVFDDSANTLKVYVNEALAGTSTGITSVPGSTTGINLTIGAYYNGDYEWINGKIDDVRLYNRALSVDEVSNLYDLGK